MRILAIGLGGAGGQIVNKLYRTDRRSSKVACVQALVVDVDKAALARLSDIPDTAKIYFPPLDMVHPDDAETGQTATIDVAEVCARTQTLASGDTDAIIFCMGLGGTMVDTAPHIISSLRSSVTEPIFALVTLPCLAEGERCSAKAADDIEMIVPLLDGVIVFDNETWYKKVKAFENTVSRPDLGFAARIGLGKKKEPTLSPTEKTYSLLNDAIIRRLSLILRAGEFKADGGVDLAEVVLDSGEVLNTMRGMGFITIGYAVEQLPKHPLGFLARLRPAVFFADEHMKKASRIVDLAKQAIYHEISAPCDITSAHKALILIAGPSHELSLKGFMTVRKWIDRSIAGLETRSGDYPVTSTKFVAIIVMLSGLENIPRITELKEIRTQFRSHATEAARPSLLADLQVKEGVTVQPGSLRDEMITLDAERTPRAHRKTVTPHSEEVREPPALTSPLVSPKGQSRRVSVIPGPQKTDQPSEAAAAHRTGESVSMVKKLLTTRSAPRTDNKETGSREGPAEQGNEERKKIEQELQRQRRLAIQGIQRQGQPFRKERADNSMAEPATSTEAGAGSVKEALLGAPPAVKQVRVAKQTGKTVVIHKKQVRREDGGSLQDSSPVPTTQKQGSPSDKADTDLLDSWIRQVTDRKKGAQQEETRSVQIDDHPATVRDDALLHTDLKRERPVKDGKEVTTGIRAPEPPREILPAGKKRSRTDDSEDLTSVE